MKRHAVLIACCVILSSLLPAADAPAPVSDYAVVVSRGTSEDAGWKRVVDALVERHRARVVAWSRDVTEATGELEALLPRYTCFVATPPEAGREFVAAVHRITRRLDDDPYSDTIWGILTGFDADNALRIARHEQPLVVRKVASGTDVALEMCVEGVWYCELNQGKVVRKKPGGEAVEGKGPADATKALVDSLNEYRADLFVTSGHATERNWQIGFRFRSGHFKCEAGQIYGQDLAGKRYPVQSPNPKVYLPIGNCLMGHVDSQDAMALAFMNSAGVNQMIGYTVPTWFGYSGWGCLDYFVEQPGRYTFAEAFFANQQALLHRLETCFPDIARADLAPGKTQREIAVGDAARQAGLTAQDGRGLLFDRDVVALYGDPAWSAKMADGPRAFEQRLTREGSTYTFEIEPTRGAASFATINANGSQRGGRPFFELFPSRLAEVELVEGKELRPLITDNFILVPHPGACDPKKSYRVVFRASVQPRVAVRSLDDEF